jgi:hypothetical protein
MVPGKKELIAANFLKKVELFRQGNRESAIFWAEIMNMIIYNVLTSLIQYDSSWKLTNLDRSLP